MMPAEKFDQISPSILRIETRRANGTTSELGTGFIIGRKRESNRLIVATAKHLLDKFPVDETVTWKVQQFDEVGEVEREISFRTNPSMTPDVPYRIHKTLDVAFCQLPAANTEPFARDGEQPLRVIEPRFRVTTGTPVAWAGFPGAIERRLGHPQLCCFSGIICSMIHGEGRRKRYILDGHVTNGVSGGPVWQWSEERDRLEVVGIISCVPAVTDGRPGYLFVEPINPVMLYLEDWRAKSPDDFVITACRD